jgi:glycerophosphoryl diester phosphodiesterase
MKYIAIILLLSACFLKSCNFKGNQENTMVTTEEKFSNHADKIKYYLRNPSEEHVLVVSHRGDWRYAPENSYQAVKRCIDLGVDIVEIDVRKTKDGHMVLMHDETVDRTTNGTGRVEDLSLKEIRQLRLKNNCGVIGSMQKVPTLEEIMTLTKDKILVNLDKTEGKTLKEAYQILKKTGTVGQTIFKGNDSLEYMYDRYGALLDSVIYMPKLWYDTPNIPRYIAQYNKKLKPMAYEMLFDNTESEVFRTISEMKSNNISVLTVALWDDLTAGHTDEKSMLEGADQSWGWLIDNGANAIMTDRPEELIEYLSAKGLRK